MYQFFPDENYERVLSFVDAESAVICARNLVLSLGARQGTTTRVIITDGGDYTNFDWRFGRGIIFPPIEEEE